MAGIGAVAIAEVGTLAIAGITVTTTIITAGSRNTTSTGRAMPAVAPSHFPKTLAYHVPARVPCGCRVDLRLASSHLLP